MAVFAVLLVGLGSGFYLIANLGPGPRDGLMTGIQRITNFPIAAVRAGIEITVVSIGWYLGGTGYSRRTSNVVMQNNGTVAERKQRKLVV